MRLCAIAASAFDAYGVCTEVPQQHYLIFEDRQSQIALGELLADILLVAHFACDLNGASNVCLRDNMSVIHVIVNGAAMFRDLCTLAHALHIRFNALGVTTWWEHVQSASNLADGGTRAGLTNPIMADLGLRLLPVRPLNIPTTFPWLSPSDYIFFHGRFD